MTTFNNFVLIEFVEMREKVRGIKKAPQINAMQKKLYFKAKSLFVTAATAS